MAGNRQGEAFTEAQPGCVSSSENILLWWPSEDPISFTAGDPNTSRYCGNEPVNTTDPSGMDPPMYFPGAILPPGHDPSELSEGAQEAWRKWMQQNGGKLTVPQTSDEDTSPLTPQENPNADDPIWQAHNWDDPENPGFGRVPLCLQVYATNQAIKIDILVCLHTALRCVELVVLEATAGLSGAVAGSVFDRIIITRIMQASRAEKLLTETGELVAQDCRLAAPAQYPEGSFSVIDWAGYPEGVPKPQGPFRLIEGEEYQAARNAANSANRAMHQADPSLAGKQIHEIQPVKFGGSPTDPANKIPLTPQQHAPVTNWWNKLMRSILGD